MGTSVPQSLAGKLPGQPHVLYRFFDDKGSLLYVGMTMNPSRRFQQHGEDKPWWQSVARITVERFIDRATVLAAERAAIMAEAPRYNVVHNGAPGRDSASARTPRTASGQVAWTFSSLRSGYERAEPLWLYWEISGDPISDGFYVDEIEPEELWLEWARQYGVDPYAESVFGPGAVQIHWFVEGDSVFEGAPYADLRISMARAAQEADPQWTPEDVRRYHAEHSFLSAFSTPYNTATSEPIRWAALPVIDKVWRHHRLPDGPHAYKGGFIQEATGWKPSALQPFVNVKQLALASGLYLPEVERSNA